MRRRKRFFIYLGIAALATLAGGAASGTSLVTQIEQRTYDYRFGLKELFPVPTSAPITILAIDKESLQGIPDPLMLWHRHFATVLNHIVPVGASAIGLDVLFSPIGRFDPEGEAALARTLLSADVPIVLAFRVRDGGPDPIPERLLWATDEEHTGYVNLRNDDDDFVRSQRLQDEDSHPGFALAIANAFANRTNKPLKFPVGHEPVLIDYLPRGTFPRVSFYDAFMAAERKDGAFFQNSFAGKIVLIGMVSESGGDDLHSTPLYYSAGAELRESSRTPGIEIHANTIAMLIDNRPIRELSRSGHVMILGLVSLALTFIWAYLRRLALASSLVLVVLYGVFVSVMFLNGMWVWIVPPGLSAGAALVMTLGANYFLEGREKGRIRDLFKGYVSDAVIGQLLEEPDGVILKGERRRIAVLFADVKGFTTLSESLPPEKVVQLLNEYFGVMVGLIQSRGGTVNSLMGDGIMAVFGAPIVDGDAALHAVEAGQAMMRALAQVNESLAANGFDAIGIGVGINSGDAVIGNMGSVQKMEYTAIGDVVNTAARIEGQTRHIPDADILISEDAYLWIDGRIPAEFAKEAELKGKGQTVRLYRVPWKSGTERN